jgi:hypothetical protein
MSQVIVTPIGTLTITRVVVGATATLLIPAAQALNGFTIINNSAVVMDMGASTVAPGTGIPIQGGGGAFSLDAGTCSGTAAATGVYGAITGGGGDCCVVLRS